jgi:hypothetical protein
MKPYRPIKQIEVKREAGRAAFRPGQHYKAIGPDTGEILKAIAHVSRQIAQIKRKISIIQNEKNVNARDPRDFGFSYCQCAKAIKDIYAAQDSAGRFKCSNCGGLIIQDNF